MLLRFLETVGLLPTRKNVALRLLRIEVKEVNRQKSILMKSNAKQEPLKSNHDHNTFRTRALSDVPDETFDCSLKLVGESGYSLTEAAQLAQKQVGILARVVYVMQDGLAANIAGVIYNHVAVAQKPLHDGRCDSHVLNIA